VEFQHFQEVRNDMVDLRAGILQAGSTDRRQYQTVQLGTTYPPRLFTINPPAPAGVLQTSSEGYNITIERSDGSGEPVEIPTRFIRYQPGYNEIDQSPIRYDATVLYVDARGEGGRPAVIESQDLVTENGTLEITALQNDFRKSGTRRVSLELYPADSAGNLSQLDGPLNVSIPTRLGSEVGYWNESDINTSDSVTYLDVDDGESSRYSGGVSELRLRVDSPDNITVNSVGIQSEPSEGAVRDNVGPSNDEDNDDSNDGPDASRVSYVDGSGSAARAGGEDRVDLDIQNNGGSDVVITGISVDSNSGNLRQLYETRGGSGVGQHEVYIDSSDPGVLEQGGSAGAGNEGNTPYQLGTQEALTEQATLAAGEQAQVTLLEFRNNGGNTRSAADKQISVTLYFQDGSSTSFTFTPPGY